MLDIHRLEKSDLSAIDIRSLSPEYWHAVKREVVRRAHAERATMAREAIARLRAWWGNRTQERSAQAQPAGRLRHFPTARTSA